MVEINIGTIRDAEVYAVLRSKDGTIKSITGPAGELPPTEETVKKIMEES